MLDHNLLGGKLNHGLSAIDSYSLLKEGKQLSSEEIILISSLGWCIEWLQGYFLVHDDIMDGSSKRRGQPCWFRLDKVGMIAVNDGVLLRNHIAVILKQHFRGGIPDCLWTNDRFDYHTRERFIKVLIVYSWADCPV